MKNLKHLSAVLLTFLLSGTITMVFASGGGSGVDIQRELGKQLQVYTVIPFAILLLAIAVMPLLTPHWWEYNKNKAIISVFCALPILALLATQGHLGQEAIAEAMHEFYAFIILLLALYTISGGILIEGDIEATPLVNTTFLAIGGLLASFIGTTGAAMLLIRPLIRTNSERKHTVHIFVFFIFIVANIGGLLLPVGDPPLFLGYLYGVPFFWTLKHLWPMWITTVAILLGIFYVWDMIAHAKENKADIRLDHTQIKPIRIHGKINFLLIAGVIMAVVFLKDYTEAEGGLKLAWAQQPVMILLALVSFLIDHEMAVQGREHHYKKIEEAIHDKSIHVDHIVYHPHTPRHRNHFGFAPIVEVAALFFGIFVTMIPALCLLKANGASLGVDKPWQFFWMSGTLSSFLDNAPTYATFFALGQGVTESLLAATPNLPILTTPTGPLALSILTAISLGAVFMGANTYIGNAPNFMVKAICEYSKIKMPGFFGYMVYSMLILVPVFFLVMVMFI